MRKHYPQMEPVPTLGELADDLDGRLDRLERAFDALLEDIAHNPMTAVEMARSYLRQD